MKKGIEFFYRKLENSTNKIYKQFNKETNENTLILNKMKNRLLKRFNIIDGLRNNGGTDEEIFSEIQDYYKLSYTGSIDSIGSYTLYLLLVYTNISLPEAQILTGVNPSDQINKGGLSKIRSRKRWESLHEDGFLTEEEKAEAIRDFKEIAPLVSTKYDLTLSAPIENRIN